MRLSGRYITSCYATCLEQHSHLTRRIHNPTLYTMQCIDEHQFTPLLNVLRMTTKFPKCEINSTMSKFVLPQSRASSNIEEDAFRQRFSLPFIDPKLADLLLQKSNNGIPFKLPMVLNGLMAKYHSKYYWMSYFCFSEYPLL